VLIDVREALTVSAKPVVELRLQLQLLELRVRFPARASHPAPVPQLSKLGQVFWEISGPLHFKGVAKACRFLAEVEVHRLNPAAARLLLERASELGRQIGDVVEYVYGLETRGRIELIEGSFELAERCFDEVVRLSESLNIRDALARGCLHLGLALKYLGAMDGAMVNLKRAVEIYEELGMRREAEGIRGNLGIVEVAAS